MGSQQDIVGNIEGILCIPCGVIFRDIKGFKVIMVEFHFGAFSNLEAQTNKNVFNFVQHGSQRVLMP